MTEHDHDELQELDPLEEAAPPPSASQYDYRQGIFQRLMAGAPPPFFNPSTSKEYYRFLLAGVLIVLGCFMPWDHDWSHVGYKTFTGGIWLVIGLGLVWSMWGAINTGVLRMKWALLAFLPFVWGLIYLIFFATFPEDPDAINGWNELFSGLFDRQDTNRFAKIGNALQWLGPGKLFVFAGAALAELSFVLGIFGGVQRMKQQKTERGAVRPRR